MTLCKFYLQGTCKFGSNCRFEHSTGGGSRFGALAGNNKPAGGNSTQRAAEKYRITADAIEADLTSDAPTWILSAYAPGREAPGQLFGGYPREQSFEEMRLLHVIGAAGGNEQQALKEAQDLYTNAQMQMQNAVKDLQGAVDFVANQDNEHPNRHDICQQGTQGQPFGEFEWSNRPMNQDKKNAQATGTSSASPFGGGAQTGSGFGQPSALGQKPNPFGQPAQQTQGSAFGQPSQLGGGGSAFGQPSKLGGGGSAFGQPSSLGQKPNPFGQSSQQTQGSGFGQLAQSGSQSSGFGQTSQLGAKPNPFGQPSQTQGSAFGQPSQPGNTGSAFGQPSQLGGGGSAFGQPSQLGGGGSAFGQASQLGQKPNPFGSAPASSNNNNNASPFASAANNNNSNASPFANAGNNNAAKPNPFGQSSQTQNAAPSPFASAGNNQDQSKPNPFGQPSQPAGQTSAFGQPSQPAPQTSAFGQPSQPGAKPNPFASAGQSATQNTANPFASTGPQQTNGAFGQPSGGGSNPFGQPSQNATVNANAMQTGGEDNNPYPPDSSRKHPPVSSYSSKGMDGRLSSFRDKPVTYQDELPGIRQFDGTWQRIWFPSGPPTYNKDTALPVEEYDAGSKDAWEKFAQTGEFADGIMPELPPPRDCTLWNF